MGGREFKTRLERFEGVGTWTYAKVPAAAMAAFGRAGQIKVKGTINGFPFRSTLMPDGEGGHFLVVNRAMRDAARAETGATVRLAIEADPAPRAIEPPPDLAKALARNKAARAAWESFPFSHKKRYVDWITEARQEATRARRVEQALARMAVAPRPKS